MTQIVIIDDEADARATLRDFLTSYCPNVEILGEADGMMSGLKLIRTVKPHAVLLDIQMKDGTGFDLLDKFKPPDFQVIFTTAFDEFAVKAFKYNAVDYLLKPISIDELMAATDKISARHQSNISQEQINGVRHSVKTKEFERLALSSSDGVHFVELSALVRLKSDGNYTTFYLVNGEKITVSKPIKHSLTFCRFHFSEPINRILSI